MTDTAPAAPAAPPPPAWLTDTATAQIAAGKLTLDDANSQLAASGWAPLSVPTGPAAVARATIAEMKTPAVARILSDPNHPEYEATHQKWTEAHQAAHAGFVNGSGEHVDAEGAKVEQAAPARTAAEYDVRLQAPPDTPLEQIVEHQQLAAVSAAAMQLDPQLAIGGIRFLEEGIAERNGRAMDAAELDGFEETLRTRWGADHGAKLARVEAAIKQAGKGGDWLKRSILSAGPTKALWAFETLAGRRG